MSEPRRVTRRRVLQIIASAGGGLAVAGRSHGAASPPAPAMETWRGVALGARATISVCHDDPAEARRLLSRSVAEIRRLEDVLSLYRRDSAITRLNRDGRIDYPPPDLVHLLSLARSYGDATGGAFDPTVQPLWNLYAGHFARAPGRGDGPDRRSVDRVRAMVDYRNVAVASRRIRFANPGMGVTLNGIAQGYITDRVTELLRNEGLTDLLVDLGEIRGLGRHGDGRPWQVGLKHAPSGETVGSVVVENQAVATSAGLATRFEESGRHHHLFDPRTGESTRRYRGITVVAPTATAADALSTAFSSMTVEDMRGVLAKYPGAAARVTTRTGETLTLTGGV